MTATATILSTSHTRHFRLSTIYWRVFLFWFLSHLLLDNNFDAMHQILPTEMRPIRGHLTYASPTYASHARKCPQAGIGCHPFPTLPYKTAASSDSKLWYDGEHTCEE